MKSAEDGGADGVRAGQASVKFFEETAILATSRHFPEDVRAAIMMGEYRPVQEDIDALDGILRFCDEENITPVLITTPYSSYYHKNVPDGFYGQFYAAVAKAIEGRDVNYYDYSRDPRFYDHPERFGNADHLNEAGAEFFTRIVFDEVEELKGFTQGGGAAGAPPLGAER
jgi:hypothetical protein